MSHLNSFILFQNDSVHAVFKDKSSLIVHPDQKTITYFNKFGQRQRTTIMHSRKSDGFHEKLVEVLQMMNRYSSHTNFILSDVEKQYDEVVKLKSVNSTLWNVNDFVIEENDQEIVAQSSDTYSTIQMSKANFNIQLTYLQQVPKRKMIQQQYHLPLNENKEFHFVNEFLNKQEQKKKSSEVKLELGFLYYFVKKDFSLFNFPLRWSYPIFLLYSKIKSLGGFEQSNIQPGFPEELINYFKDKNQSTDSINENKFATMYSCYKLNQTQFIIQLPDKVRINEADISTTLSNDDLPPANDFISNNHLDIPSLMVTNDISVWFNNKSQAFGYIFNSKQIVYRVGNYWHRFSPITKEEEVWEEKSNIVHLEFKNIDAIFHHLVFKLNLKANSFVKKSSQGLKQLENSIYQIQQGDFEVVREINLIDIGSFLGLKNGSVKAKFKDRAIISFIYPPPCDISILMPGGLRQVFLFDPKIDDSYIQSEDTVMKYIPEEFSYYVENCIKFAEECFVIPEIQNQRKIYKADMSNWISKELEKNSRFLYLTGKIEIGAIQKEVLPCEDNFETTFKKYHKIKKIDSLITANEQMLQKLKQIN